MSAGVGVINPDIAKRIGCILECYRELSTVCCIIVLVVMDYLVDLTYDQLVAEDDGVGFYGR